MISQRLERLCRFAAGLRLEAVPEEARDWARRIVIDTLGVITAGNGLAATARLAAGLGGPAGSLPQATCPGLPGGRPLLEAVLINGAGGSSLELDEGNSWLGGMPSIQLLPPALALAETEGLSGAEFLAGFMAGYEVAYRIGLAAPPRPGLHPTGSWGLLGAAGAAARLRRRGPEEMFHILNLAAAHVFCPALDNSLQGRNASTTYAGLAGQLGLLADLLFQSGIRAEPAGLETTFNGVVSQRLEEERLDQGLGSEWGLLTGYLKPYPACRQTHTALEALEAILEETRFAAEEVELIRVEDCRPGAPARAGKPPNPEAMRFSLPYLLAALVVQGRLDLSVIDRETLDDPRVARLAARVEVAPAPDLVPAHPARQPVRVRVELRGGQVLDRALDEARGGLGRPLSWAQVEAKFLSLASPVIGRGRAGRFLSQARTLEELPHLGGLVKLLRSPT